MKLFHISDLHIGRLLHRYNLGSCQQEVFDEIIRLAVEAQPDVMMIAGDIFDKPVPSGEAYTIFDTFLNDLTDALPQMTVLIIAGNHDSAERLQYASTFLQKHHIYISVLPPADPQEHLKKVTLEDEFGEVDFYLLPFTKPSHVRKLFEDGRVITWSEAVAEVLRRENIDYTRRNVILSHQFYASEGCSPETCDSEQTSIAVGGIDQVDVELLSGFEYAALGHLHGSQKVGYSHVRYSGTPLKYSVSEEHQKKSVVQVVLGPKGCPADITLLPLSASRDVRTVRGTLEEVLQTALERSVLDSSAAGQKEQDYVSIVLTDDDDGLLTDAKERLEERYEHILEIRVDNRRTRARFEDNSAVQEEWTMSQAFARFFEDMNHRPMTEQENGVMEQIWKEMEGLS
ncbi:MAG: exonuclease SbcCD subunit D [Lachnospiraceae bacterium]|nr:exonuclease SbcCD subunit D [Lachnospiraceae bacterium]MDY4971260.1 exonuclease SbcCD subunit D [Lachnospiraceae bacterium]